MVLWLALSTKPAFWEEVFQKINRNILFSKGWLRNFRNGFSISLRGKMSDAWRRTGPSITQSFNLKFLGSSWSRSIFLRSHRKTVKPMKIPYLKKSPGSWPQCKQKSPFYHTEILWLYSTQFSTPMKTGWTSRTHLSSPIEITHIRDVFGSTSWWSTSSIAMCLRLSPSRPRVSGIFSRMSQRSS